MSCPAGAKTNQRTHIVNASANTTCKDPCKHLLHSLQSSTFINPCDYDQWLTYDSVLKKKKKKVLPHVFEWLPLDFKKLCFKSMKTVE